MKLDKLDLCANANDSFGLDDADVFAETDVGHGKNEFNRDRENGYKLEKKISQTSTLIRFTVEDEDFEDADEEDGVDGAKKGAMMIGEDCNERSRNLQKFRPKKLDLGASSLQLSASTDELMNLEMREKNFMDCKTRASIVIESIGLRLSGREVVKDRKSLKTLRDDGVGRILCCYDDEKAEVDAIEDFEFERMSLPLEDTSEEDILCVLYDAFDFILGNARTSSKADWEKSISRSDDDSTNNNIEGASCLVYCQAGCSRSVAIAIAFIMWRENISYDDAFAVVKKARPIARPNMGFQKQLEFWQNERETMQKLENDEQISVVYRIVEHRNRPGYVVPKISRERTCLSPKDEPNMVALRFDRTKSRNGRLLPEILIGDAVDREKDPRLDEEEILDRITQQIMFYEFGITNQEREEKE
jgi:hypothetical protein